MEGEALLLALALRALDDPDFLPVLGDAVQETKWTHPELMYLVGGEDNFTVQGKKWPSNKPDNSRTWVQDDGDRSATPTKKWAAAVAVLCLGWRTEPWRDLHFRFGVRGGRYEQLRTLYDYGAIDQEQFLRHLDTAEVE